MNRIRNFDSATIQASNVMTISQILATDYAYTSDEVIRQDATPKDFYDKTEAEQIVERLEVDPENRGLIFFVSTHPVTA